MKHIFFIFTIYTFILNNLQGQVTIDCQGEIRIKNQKINDLEKFNSSLQKQNSELQTRVILSGTPCPPCPPTNDIENNEQKKEIISFKKQLEQLAKQNETKEGLLTEAIQNNTKLSEDIKNLNKTSESKDQEIKKLLQDIEDCKNKYALIEKAVKDSAKSLILIKTNYQILYDSLYQSIDFKKEVIHLDVKFPDNKEMRIDDILVELPYNIINSNDWTPNNIEQKLKRIAALYVKYRDKIRIQLLVAPIDTEEEKTSVSAVLRKVMSKFNTYANIGLMNDKRIVLDKDNDFDINLNTQGKKGVVRIVLIKRK